MMFSDEEIKEIPESTFMRPGDEIISIHEVCLSDKFDKKDSGYRNEPLLSATARNDLDGPRSLFRDGFFPENTAKFAWTEEEGIIASFVSEPPFSFGQGSFSKDIDSALKSDIKMEADTSSSIFQTSNRNGMTFTKKPCTDPQIVSSTSNISSGTDRGKNGQGPCKVDKADPRSRFHFVKYVKRHGRTVKLWECGICSREFQHQYTLMRHLPTHTDERNFHCNACGKSFRQLSTLSQHRAIHSAARPYACEVCNKTFNRVSTLISHRKTHSDEKPYKCHICPKGFHQKGNLRNHLFTHTNARPYRCNICLKGFNQQSNLVCHKNKAHPDDDCATVPSRGKSATRPPSLSGEKQPDSTGPPADQCEVSSSVGPYLPSMEGPSTSTWNKNWDFSKLLPETNDIWNDSAWGSMGNGVIVDPIKTYHMGVALATRQTPFALLKPDDSTPVLVKVIDTKLPGGKQMLVPATAKDLKVGGKIVLNNEENSTVKEGTSVSDPEVAGAVQIRVPVVATVVPRFQPGGRLHLAVEEPHHAYHTALSADIGPVKIEPCSSGSDVSPVFSTKMTSMDPLHTEDPSAFDDHTLRPGTRISSTCALPPPAPSPPLDFSSMDLFEPMECIPMGPQITAVDIEQPPPSDDSDIFIGEFKESIALSDSD
ncbi:zinc finger and SCAN domain-containing protein 12-like [Galleria mellonella]|uniref:Zinc finger and SCAN domain-containing protein 12-like n=1 Tax=Galleria mellonella TaxID=7137 RepID=A0A6J1WKI5_GALME|nr:zinc finger and SCAN domain-containing protein 12-like [Galleria mellonella]